MDPAPLSELLEVLGPAGVLSPDTEDLGRYLDPARGQRGAPCPVVRPADVEQVRSTLQWARRHRVRVLPQGANSGLVGASTPPVEPDGALVVLSTDRLRAEPLLDVASRTAVVTAGTRLSQLNELAGVHGLELPIDLGADPTVGGMVATNTGGSRMLAHGDMRRHVLGVRAVTADEECSVIDELTTLRKHNTGTALTHLLVGSGGAFAVICDVALELERRPESRATAWVVPRDPAACVETIVALEAMDAAPSAYEVVSAHALDAVRRHSPGVRLPFDDVPAPELSALIELSGRSAPDRLLDALDRLTGDGLLLDAIVLPPADAWAVRHRVTESLRAWGTVIGHDVSVPRSALPEFRAAGIAAVRAALPDAVVADFGHWGDGGVHFNVVVDGAVPDQVRSELADVVLGLVVDRFDGSFSAEHGLGPLNARWWERTVSDGTRAGIQALSERLDPLGILGHPGVPY